MVTAITSGKIITEGGRIILGTVLVEDTRIRDVLPCGARLPLSCQVVDVRGKYVSPGFIDIHVHGGGGSDFMDGSVAAILNAAKAHLPFGTTALYPTTATSSEEDLLRTIQCFRKAQKEEKAPRLLGLHLEGPYIADEQKGAQDAKYLQLPRREHYLKLLKLCPEIARISAAPELPGGLELGDELTHKKILVAVGHSNAEYDDMLRACRHGYSHITHLYSGMSMLKRVRGYRKLGVVESAFLMDEYTIEIIADGKHLPSELLRLIVKCKRNDQICLITDAMRGMGMPEGSEVALGSSEGGQIAYIENGVAVLPDREAFAGSVCSANRCVRTMVQAAGVPLGKAVMMMTENPAKVMKCFHNLGSISPGKLADIIVFDDNVNVEMVMVNGKICCSNNSGG